MKKAGLIGVSLGHSYSGRLFRHFFAESLIEGEYRLFELNTSEIRDFLAKKKDDPEFMGFNVTIPHKKAIMEHLDSVDEAAKEIGAVNCVYKRDGFWIGTNTDFRGFLTVLLEKFNNSFNDVLILGTGGAASAVAYALKKAETEHVYAWSRKKQSEIFDRSNLNILPWDGAICEMIVNCTPIGTTGFQDDFPKSIYESIQNSKFYWDLVYNPQKTKMMLYSEAAGIGCVNGLGMLLEQASLSAEYWFGKSFSTKLKQKLISEL